jgi:hypothetical protein
VPACGRRLPDSSPSAPQAPDANGSVEEPARDGGRWSRPLETFRCPERWRSRLRDSQPVRAREPGSSPRTSSASAAGLGWPRDPTTGRVKGELLDVGIAAVRANHVSVPSSDPSSDPASVPPSGHDRSTRSRSNAQVRRPKGSSVYWSDSIRYACIHAARPFEYPATSLRRSLPFRFRFHQ